MEKRSGSSFREVVAQHVAWFAHRGFSIKLCSTQSCYGACHNNLLQPVAAHRQGNARRMPLNAPTVYPPSDHASRAAAALALPLAGIPPHTAPDQHTTHTTPRPYKPPVASIPALKPPLSAAAVATAHAPLQL